MVHFNSNEDKGFFIVTALIGLFSSVSHSINGLITADFSDFIIVVCKAVTLAFLSGAAGVLSKKTMEYIFSKFKKKK